jgi:hypothetical protein
MNFRELINKLDQINEAEGLTLQSIAATEKAAMDKAVAEKAKGGFTGFTSWDPRTAGNIALAKLAQQNNFEGLFNSDGDFVVAFGDRTWSSQGDGNGTAPRVVPPTPDDWKPLAAKGLVPQNAKGPAGLTNWLSSGGAQKEFDAVKKQSADAAASTPAPVDAAQAPKITSADEEAKMTQLEALVEQYLKLKEDIKTGVNKVQAAKVTAARDPMDDSDDAYSHEFDPTWGGTKATGGQSVAPNAGATWDNAKQIAVPGVVKESTLASALVESFGYQKKTSIAGLVENFVYQNKNFRKLLEADDDLSLTSKYDKDKKDNDNFDPDAYLQSKYGDAANTKSGRVDRRTWQEKNVTTTVPKAVNALRRTIDGKNKKPVSKDEQDWWDTAFKNKYWNNWTEDTLSWDDEIIPYVFTFRDLAMDLGIATGLVVGGAILAPFTAGASIGGTVAGGILIVRWLIRIARGLVFLFNSWGPVVWNLVKLNGPKIRRAFSVAIKPHKDAWNKALVDQLGPKAFGEAFLWTIGFNGLSELIKDRFPKAHAAIGKGVDDALDAIQPGIDWARNRTGLEEGLQ